MNQLKDPLKVLPQVPALRRTTFTEPSLHKVVPSSLQVPTFEHADGEGLDTSTVARVSLALTDAKDATIAKTNANPGRTNFTFFITLVVKLRM